MLRIAPVSLIPESMSVVRRNSCRMGGQVKVYPGDDTPKTARVVTKARWGKDPNTVLTGSTDGFLRVWDIRSREKIRKVG